MTTQRVRISRAMDRPELEELLDALLYHEMCHAVVGMYRSQTSGRRVYHGPEFRELERRHPAMRNLDQWIKSGGWSRAVRSYSAHLGARSRVKSVTVYKK
jgi:predicted SprT family Zn-dependent metalloprotease